VTTGKTRSSIYRESDTAGTVLYELKRILPRKGAIKRRTDAVYLGMDIWKGIEPAVVKEAARRTVHKARVAVATRRANAAKQSTADERAKKARSMQAQGKTQREIAAAVGVTTTRSVRKLLKR
jgi:hypothetical protein